MSAKTFIILAAGLGQVVKPFFMAIPPKHRLTVVLVGIVVAASLAGFAMYLHHGLLFEILQIIKAKVLLAGEIGHGLAIEAARLVAALPSGVRIAMEAVMAATMVMFLNGKATAKKSKAALFRVQYAH